MYFFQFFSFIFLLFSFSIRASESSLALELEEAKKLAIEKSLEVSSLKKNLEEMSFQKARATSKYFPTLGMAGGVDSKQSSEEQETVGVGYLYGQMNLFRGFEDSYKVSKSDLEVEKTKIKLSKAQFRIGLEMEKVFYNYIFTKMAIQLKKKAWDLNETQKKLAQKRKESGLIGDSDLMEFDLRDSLLQSDIASLEQELEESRIALKRLLGEENGSKIEPSGTFIHWHLKDSLKDLLKKVKEQNEAILLAQKEVSIAEYEHKLSHSKWFPEINLEVKGGYLSLDDRASNGEVTFRGMVLAKWDLFSGWDTLQEKKAAEANQSKQDALYQNAILNAQSEVETLYRKIKAIETRVHLEEQNENRAQKYHQAVINEYKRGVRNSADVRMASESLFEASLRQQSFKYAFIVQRIELEKALGAPVEIEPMTIPPVNLEESHEFLQKIPQRKKN